MRPLGERIATQLLVAGVVCAPLALGAANQWLRFSLELAVVASSILWALTARRPTWLQIVPGCVALVGILQVVPLPEWLLTAISPISAGAWKVASAGLTSASGCVSVDAHASIVAACRLFLGVSVVAVVSSLARHKPYREQLMAGLVIVGVLVISAGVVFGPAPKDKKLLGLFALGGPGEIAFNPVGMPVETAGFGVVRTIQVGAIQYAQDVGYSGDGFGTYIYSNHFAGGMILTLPFIVAAWLVWSRERVPDWARFGIAAIAFASATWLVGAVAHSRAGAGAIMFAGLVLAACSAQRQWAVRVLLAVVIAYALLVACGLALMLAPSEFVLPRVPEKYRSFVSVIVTDARNMAAQVALRMFIASPLLGTGVDTYTDIFPRFIKGSYVLFYAHNDIVQWLAETGLCGAAIIGWAGYVLMARGRRFCETPASVDKGLFAASWAALAGIIMHSAFDWNLHLPANALLASVVAGLAIASAPSKTSKDATTKGFVHIRAAVPYVFVVTCLLAGASLARETFSQSASKHLRKAIIGTPSGKPVKDPEGERALLLRALQHGERLAGWDPGNSQLAALLGQATLHAAVLEDDPAAREAGAAQAEKWFAIARKQCAVVRGLPWGIRDETPGNSARK